MAPGLHGSLAPWFCGTRAPWFRGSVAPGFHGSVAHLLTVTVKESPPAAAMSSPQSKHLHLTALISTAKVTGGNRRPHTTGRLIERAREQEEEGEKGGKASKHGENGFSVSIFHVGNWLINPAA